MGMNPPFLTCSSFQFCSIDKQTQKFLADLSDVDRGRLQAGAEILAASLASGRPSGRSERIRGAKIGGLFEFKATLPGGGPQLRMICVRERNRILCARGFEKRGRRLPRDEIEAAERAIAAYRKKRDEGGKGKRSRR
jgi:hypothetical protein